MPNGGEVVMYTVTVRMENTYSQARESNGTHLFRKSVN